MKIINELEINFIRIIHKNYDAITRLEKNKKLQRQNYIKEQFEFTPKVYKKLILLNKKLRQEEERIFCKYRQIEKKCDLMVNKKDIDSYNLEVVVKYFNNNHYSKYDSSFENKPFFETGSEGDFMESRQKRMQFDTIVGIRFMLVTKGLFTETPPCLKLIIVFHFIICMTTLN